MGDTVAGLPERGSLRGRQPVRTADVRRPTGAARPAAALGAHPAYGAYGYPQPTDAKATAALISESAFFLACGVAEQIASSRQRREPTRRRDDIGESA